MENITSVSIHVTLGLALLLFVVASAWRLCAAAIRTAGIQTDSTVGMVQVGQYRPMDLLGMAGFAGLFYGQGLLTAIMGESKKQIEASSEQVILSIGLQFLLAGIAVAIVRSRVDLVTWLGLKWTRSPWFFVAAPVSVLCVWAVLMCLQGLGYAEWMDQLGVKQVQDSVALFQREKDVVILTLFAVTATLVAPICEEVIFRGYLYPSMKHFVGPWVAGLCSALVFSAAHGSLTALIPLFIFGVALAALYELTGSILAPMAAHFMFNSASVQGLLLIRLFDLPVSN